MGKQIKHFMDEADIGSGEKSPGQEDIERDQDSANTTPTPKGAAHAPPADDGVDTNGRVLQSGTHLARILAVRQSDETYEAQVYVRLTREPEVAETYIPVGSFATEAEAWAAAEERARRAFKDNEF